MSRPFSDAVDSTQICILGAGFGGSLLALILRKLGRDVLLIDKGKHPRFAIGESSTPIGNRVLHDLCQRYDLPEIAPLCKWGSWRKSLPHLRGGLKRGFSYFFHELDRPFQTFPDHRTELLVAASSSDETSDTHWLRADVDHYFLQCAQRAGVRYLDQTHAQVERENGRWSLLLTCDGKQRRASAEFLIHAAGPSPELAQSLSLGDDSHLLRTKSRGLYAHFSSVLSWTEVLETLDAPQFDYPFPCDNAALHHVFPGGWMWQLRFIHQVVSLGFSLTDLHFDPNESPEAEFQRWLSRLPTIDQQLSRRLLDAEGPSLTRTGRMQRLVARAAGDRFALLPFAAGFISPLQSTGIAHTLTSVERLARAFESPALPSSDFLARCCAATRSELRFIDDLISLCYETTSRPELFHLATMTYFAAVTTYEKQRSEQGDALQADFLGAHDQRLRAALSRAAEQIRAAAASAWNADNLRDLQSSLKQTLRDYDHVGLFDPAIPRMHPHTAAPEF